MSPAPRPWGACVGLLGVMLWGKADLPRRAARPSSRSIGHMGWFFLSTHNSLKINQPTLAHGETRTYLTAGQICTEKHFLSSRGVG